VTTLLDTHFRDPYSFRMLSNESIAPRRRRVLWWALAAASLLGGFADLALGGETIAPVLLILGYCVLIPIAILQ
jgi:hypothetical protein